MTLNESWGFHGGDDDWKGPGQIVDMLARCAQGGGNLLLNIGPRGDGTVPEESVRVLEESGKWLASHSEAVFDTDLFTFDPAERGDHRGDWNSNGPLTVSGNRLFLFLRRWPGSNACLGGIEAVVRNVRWLDSKQTLAFTQSGSRLKIEGLPDAPPNPVCPILQIECDRPPVVYQCGGLRIPAVDHPHYDPCPPDIAY